MNVYTEIETTFHLNDDEVGPVIFDRWSQKKIAVRTLTVRSKDATAQASARYYARAFLDEPSNETLAYLRDVERDNVDIAMNGYRITQHGTRYTGGAGWHPAHCDGEVVGTWSAQLEAELK